MISYLSAIVTVSLSCTISQILSLISHNLTRDSAMAKGPRDALVSRNSATTKYPYRIELFP